MNEVLKVAQEMRERMVNNGRPSPTLVAWADRLEAAAARLREPAGAGGGWVLVPRKPTSAMIMAGGYLYPSQHGDAGSVYGAMIAAAAAPQPPAEAQAQGGGEPVACKDIPDWAIARSYRKHVDALDPQFHIPSALIFTSDVTVEAARMARAAPPSAPVGVEGLVAAWEADIAAAGPLNKKDLSPARFVRDLRAIAQQPPAEAQAQAQGVGAVVLVRKEVVDFLLGDGLLEGAVIDGDGRALRAVQLSASPSAPVGVEKLAAQHGFESVPLDGEPRWEFSHSGLLAFAAALAQQPAAENDDAEQLAYCREDWHQVCKAISPDGLHLNPNEVVEWIEKHKQPAAVDGAMLRKLRDYFEDINNDEYGDDYRNLSADAMDLIDSALAAQPGGSDDG